MEEEKIFVTRSSMPSYDEYCKKIKSIWETHLLTNNGVFHAQLEEEIKKYLKVNEVTLFTNGHLALENAIQALGLSGEVITTPFTFVSTTHAISRNNLIPVFCDIDSETYTIDPNKIEALITDKTSAIVPVHVYGNVCDVDKIEEIAKKHNLKVIYDAAHAFGVLYKNKSIANYGDISMFSFHATKVFNTIEGGCLAFNNGKYKTKLERLKNFGIKNEDVIDQIGGNAKMNEFQAAMGLCNLENISLSIARRKQIYLLYKELLENIKGIKLNKIQENVVSNYAYFPVLVEKDYGITRDELYELLKSHNIFSRKYFYPATNEIECYKENANKTPIAAEVSRKILTLPLYEDLEPENVKRICKIIKEKK